MDVWNPFTGTGTPLDALFGTGGSPGLFSDPSGAWDQFKNGDTNEVNEEIAQENLDYQKERNKIEDERYEEETKYNRAFQEDERDYQRAFAAEERDYQRAFAENERDYQRALQQKIFEREDTAITRQAAELAKMGINPLSQSMNGLGAGQAVSASSAPSSAMAGSASAPNASNRGGLPLHNDFRKIDQSLLSMVTPLLSMVSSVNDVMTGSKSRDALMAQKDGQILDNQSKAIDNLIKASENDISINNDGTVSLNREFKKKKQDFNEVEYADKEASKNRNVREDVFQNDYGTTDNSSTAEKIATGTAHQFERFLNGVTGVANDVGNFVKEGAQADINRAKKVYNYLKEKSKKFFKKSDKNKNDWLPAWQR